MPFDVRLPDGRILRNVPDGTTKEQIAAKLGGAIGRSEPADPDVPIVGQRYGRQPAAPRPSPTLGQRVAGAGEAALTAVTGATSGTIGTVGGFIGGLAGAIRTGEYGTPGGARRVQDTTMRAGERLTYAPRTETGRRYAAAVGEAIAQTAPILPQSIEIAAAAGNAARAAPAIRPAMRQVAERTVGPARERVERARELARTEPSVDNPQVRVSPEQAAQQRAAKYASDRVGVPLADLPAQIRAQLVQTARSAQALEGLDPAAIRRQATLAGLRTPIPATRGQLTRDLAQVTREENIIKSEAGAPLREIMAEQDRALAANLSAMRQGAQTRTEQGLGNAVQGALRGKLQFVQKRRRLLYEQAEEAGAMLDPVDVTLLDEWLLVPENARNAGWLQGALKAYREGDNAPVPVNALERIRQEASQASREQGRGGYFAGEAVRVIDDILDNAADALPEGSPYRAARAAYRAEKQEFERQGAILRLVSERRGTADRRVALEDTLDVIMRSSAADIRTVRRSLIGGGSQETRKAGAQAWREIRGGVIDHLMERATRRRRIEGEQGQVQFNAGVIDRINELHADGKLDAIFSPKEVRELLRLSEAVGIVRTKPSGRIAGSDTTPRLLSFLEGMKRLPMGNLTRGAVDAVEALYERGSQKANIERAAMSPLEEAARRKPPKQRRVQVRDILRDPH